MLVAIACGSEVIAASVQDDQPAPATQPEIAEPAAQPASSAPVTAGAPATRSHGLTRTDLVALLLAAVSLALILLTRWHRLDRVAHRPQAFTPASAMFLLGMIFLLSPLGATLGTLIFSIKMPEGENAPPLSFEDTARLQGMAVLARLLGVAAFVSLVRRVARPQPDRRASLVMSVGVGIAGLLLVWPLVQSSIALAGWIVGAQPQRIAHDLLRALAERPFDGWSALVIALVTIAGPAIEEVMYRGLLQETLRRAGAMPWPAITLSSIIFALAHIGAVQPHALIGLFVFGLALGWAYEKTGRLWAPIAMHALFNAVNVVLATA